MTFREGIVWSLCRAVADLVWYLGPQAPVAEIIKELELEYGTMASFSILMQNCYKLQQGKTEKVLIYVTHLEGALNMVQQEYPMMLSMSKVQKHPRDQLFHGLGKQLYDSKHYLYDGIRIMYPQPLTATQKAESEQQDRHREGVKVRLAQSERRDDIMSLRGQIEHCKWQSRCHREQHAAAHDHWAMQEMRIEIKIIQGLKAIIEIIMRDATVMGSNVFDLRVGDIGLMSD